jgi:hypothetical protein
MAKIMLTIFNIGKYQTIFGQIDLTQLYSAPWVKIVVKKIQLDVDVIVIFLASVLL